MKYLKFLLLFFFISCATPKVVYDYDVNTNFSDYKTYDYFEDAGEGFSELDIKRIIGEIDIILKEKGIERSNTPDFYINFIVKTKPVTSRNTVGVGVGGSGRNVGWGISGGIPLNSNKIRQLITVDFVESKDNKLFWQGVLESEIKESTTPQERDVYYKKVFEKILSGYPPKK
jgi:hypothetical protein